MVVGRPFLSPWPEMSLRVVPVVENEVAQNRLPVKTKWVNFQFPVLLGLTVCVISSFMGELCKPIHLKVLCFRWCQIQHTERNSFQAWLLIFDKLWWFRKSEINITWSNIHPLINWHLLPNAKPLLYLFVFLPKIYWVALKSVGSF